MVVSRDQPHLSFALKLVRSEKTYEYPLQSWQFVSDYAMRDYTGTYYVKLLPCTATKVSETYFALYITLAGP